MSIGVKICGLTDACGLTAALDSGADLLGFVFFPPSPRNVTVARAGELAAPARGKARIVALTVDADDRTLDAIMAGLEPDLLQLHGGESPARAAELRTRYGRPVIKALGVRTAQDVAAAANYAGAVDLILFDAKPPKGATRPGGLGRAFDWTLLAGLDLTVPFVLSGGLDPETVGEAVRIARPYAVDVSSGVESAPGVKDPEAVRRFIAEVRKASVGHAAVEAVAEKERIV